MRSKELKNELQIKSYNHGGKKTETSGNGWVENGRETNQLREGLVLFSLGFNGKARACPHAIHSLSWAPPNTLPLMGCPLAAWASPLISLFSCTVFSLFVIFSVLLLAFIPVSP
jgi:hypothetical protein